MDEDTLREWARKEEKKHKVIPLTCSLDEFCEINQLTLTEPERCIHDKNLIFITIKPPKGRIEVKEGKGFASGAARTGYGTTISEARDDLCKKLSGKEVHVGSSFGIEHLEEGWPLYKKYKLTLISNN